MNEAKITAAITLLENEGYTVTKPTLISKARATQRIFRSNVRKLMRGPDYDIFPNAMSRFSKALQEANKVCMTTAEKQAGLVMNGVTRLFSWSTTIQIVKSFEQSDNYNVITPVPVTGSVGIEIRHKGVTLMYFTKVAGGDQMFELSFAFRDPS